MDNITRLKLGPSTTFIDRSSTPVSDPALVTHDFCRVLDSIHDTIRDKQGQKNGILFLCGIRLRLFATRPDSASEKFLSMFGSDTQTNIEKAELLMRNFIKEGALL